MSRNPYTDPCTCGAPVRHARDYGRLGDERMMISWTCGATSNYDGPGEPCPNRDERTTRDETTQPPEAEEPKAMSQTTETAATQEVVAYPEVSTLPAIKPLADAALKNLGLALAVVERLKGYGKLVLVDLADKKAAKDLNEKRLEVWRASVAWRKACKEGRADANAIADAWVKAEKSLVKDFDEVEAHLEKQLEAHEKELARITKEAADALKAKIQGRLDAMTAAGIPVDLVRASDLSDEDWSEYLAKTIDAKTKLDAATKVADELTALGDECTPGEALQLTDNQIEHRLAVARKADHDRKEAKRIADEEAAAEALRIETERQRVAAEEKAARERLERGYRRGRELALLGAIGHDVEPLADMTEEAFQVALETARQEKIDRDARIAEERRIQDEKDAELARLKKDEADRLERERVALEAREREAKEAADKAEADAKAAREEAEREVRHHGAPIFAIDPIALTSADAVQAVESQEIAEALAAPTPSAQVVEWFAGIRAAIKASPDREPDTLAAIAKMLDVVQEVEDAFLPF